MTTQRFDVVKVTRQLANGQTKSREVVRHPGSVVILPQLDDGRVCLIRNHRVAVGRTLVELPAGTLEPDEAPALCAARELTEETGFQAAQLEHVISFFAAPGILDELMHLYLATDLTAGTPCREDGEEIENLVVSWEDALSLIDDGTIQDAKTILGLLIVHRQRVAT